ncbi:hypothetical protein P8452_24506 [Trifolium repens]|jgi:hypothetical protein|nr:hypothetical protein P8452_24506 [Trifolium repens]
MAHWIPPLAGYVEVNIVASWPAYYSIIGFGGILSGFISFDETGDVLPLELLGIKHGLNLALIWVTVLCFARPTPWMRLTIFWIELIIDVISTQFYFIRMRIC